jgi:hypothetical protein
MVAFKATDNGEFDLHSQEFAIGENPVCERNGLNGRITLGCFLLRSIRGIARICRLRGFGIKSGYGRQLANSLASNAE